MSCGLINKVAFITGGANGIGAAIVRAFLQLKAKHVAFLDLDDKTGLKFQSELRSTYGENAVTFHKCDISKVEQLNAVYASVIDKCGYIDMVINNAAIGREDPESYMKEIEINYTATVSSTLKAVELMRKDKGGHGGVVLNVTSMSALCPMFVLPIYGGTKAAILMFSQAMGTDYYYNKTGVKMMTICYCPTSSQMFDKFKFIYPEIAQEIRGFVNQFAIQSAESAGKATAEACMQGENGSLWISIHDKPAQDITHLIKKSHALFAEYLK